MQRKCANRAPETRLNCANFLTESLVGSGDAAGIAPTKSQCAAQRTTLGRADASAHCRAHSCRANLPLSFSLGSSIRPARLRQARRGRTRREIEFGTALSRCAVLISRSILPAARPATWRRWVAVSKGGPQGWIDAARERALRMRDDPGMRGNVFTLLKNACESEETVISR